MTDEEFLEVMEMATDQLQDQFSLRLNLLQARLGDDPHDASLRRLRKEQLLNLLNSRLT